MKSIYIGLWLNLVTPLGPQTVGKITPPPRIFSLKRRRLNVTVYPAKISEEDLELKSCFSYRRYTVEILYEVVVIRARYN